MYAQFVHSPCLQLVTTHKADNEADSLLPQLSIPLMGDAAVWTPQKPWRDMQQLKGPHLTSSTRETWR